jgi:hypothetical protein
VRLQPVPPCTWSTRRARPATSRTLARLYIDDVVLERLPQDLQDVAAELGPCIQEEPTMVSRQDLARHRHVPPADPASEMVWWGARHGRVVTNAVRSPVRPATRWIRVVSMASARIIAGRMVVSRGARIDLPAPAGQVIMPRWRKGSRDAVG